MIPRQKVIQEPEPPKNTRGITYLAGAMGSLCDRCIFMKRCAFSKPEGYGQTLVIDCKNMQEKG